ncbi:hypothetical protein ACTXT7_004961 [Hymenolepis weldensis]
MTAASSRQLTEDLSADDHKRGSIRKGSIFNLFNLSSNERLNETADVEIQLFDGTRMCALIDHRINGKTLLNHIASELGDVSKAKYLGLIIEPPGELPEWMDLCSSIAKEKSVKGFNVMMVRIKFYPADPVLEMKPDCFTNLLYFQLRHDLAVGRLLGKERDRCLMVAYSIRYEGGLKGISKDQLLDSVVVHSKISPNNLDNSMQNRIKEYLEEKYEISEEEALNSFLKVATRMDTYGIEPFDAKVLFNINAKCIRLGLKSIISHSHYDILIIDLDARLIDITALFALQRSDKGYFKICMIEEENDQRGNGIAVGFNFRGLSVFKSSQQVNFFRWESMINYEWERKNVIITIKTRDHRKAMLHHHHNQSYHSCKIFTLKLKRLLLIRKRPHLGSKEEGQKGGGIKRDSQSPFQTPFGETVMSFVPLGSSKACLAPSSTPEQPYAFFEQPPPLLNPEVRIHVRICDPEVCNERT